MFKIFLCDGGWFVQCIVNFIIVIWCGKIVCLEFGLIFQEVQIEDLVFL